MPEENKTQNTPEPVIKAGNQLVETASPEIEPQIKQEIPIQPNFIQNLLIKARAKIQERKRKKLDKIMTLFETKSQITNQDIQKLLRTSRVSAFRYLNILEQENRIKQVGKTGKSVFYTKI